MVTLDKTSDDALDRFNEAVCRIPELQSCPLIAGNFDYLLKVRTHDIAPCRAVPGTRPASCRTCTRRIHSSRWNWSRMW
ncbi:Lrp/AsnC ligand binding domain-containing protein [Stappia sp. MMSF_3263]|uniref:Lrp/AsnC ligand binding domain-containing protein n=1 Tax=Stappia sp. MMSF_3263 TaxID=3046693 RepID=UPI0034DE60CA